MLGSLQGRAWLGSLQSRAWLGSTRSGSGGLLLAGAFEQGALDQLQQELQFVGAHGEVRGEARRVLAAVDHAQAVLAQPLLGGAGAIALELRRQLAGEQQAGALDLG